MKTVAIFGGTGGLGSQLVPLLSNEFNVIALGSKDVNVSSYDSVSNFFSNNNIDKRF